MPNIIKVFRRKFVAYIAELFYVRSIRNITREKIQKQDSVLMYKKNVFVDCGKLLPFVVKLARQEVSF